MALFVQVIEYEHSLYNMYLMSKCMTSHHLGHPPGVLGCVVQWSETSQKPVAIGSPAPAQPGLITGTTPRLLATRGMPPAAQPSQRCWLQESLGNEA